MVVTGLRLLRACGRHDEEEIEAYRESIRFDEVMGTSVGELEEMNRVAAALEGTG